MGTTKSFTAASVLKLVEQGVWSLDDPIHQYVDPFLNKTNGTTLMDWWKDERINQVTLGQVVSMRSGLHDYNDQQINEMTIKERINVTPMQYIELTDKSFWCDPGTL